MNKRIIKHKKLNEAFEEFSYRQRISDDAEIKSVKDLNQAMSKLRSEAHKYGVDIDEIDGQADHNGDFSYVFSLIGSKENMEKFLRGSKIYQDFLGIDPEDPQDIEDELGEMNKHARKIAIEESAIEQPERMRTANVGDTIIYKGDKIKLKRKEFIYSEVDRKKLPVLIGEVNGKERKYFPADIDYMLKTPGTLKEAFDTSSQYEYDDLVADMFGNMSDAELDKQLRDLKRYAKHLGLKKPDDMVIIRLEGDDEYTYDPANYYRGTHLNDNVVLYDDFDTELVSLVRELINGNVWLYFANSGDAETYTTEIDRINLVDETEADSIDDFDLEDEGE